MRARLSLLPLLFLLLLPLLSLPACSRGEAPAGPGRADPASTASPAAAPAAGPDAPAPAAERPPNVLLVTLDSTRADRLGCYGHEAASTPHLDRLAARGARFERAYAHVPLTLPAHAGLFTGTYPPEHGLRDNGRDALGPDLATMAELLGARGLRTGAFVGALALDSAFGLDRGFEVYDDDLGGSGAGLSPLRRRGGEVVDSALAWLRVVKDEPFFAFVHLHDAHSPAEPPAPFDERHADPYDGALAYLDSCVGRLLGWLESEDLAERTIVLALADHGEGLGEHGEATHGALLFEGTLRIPMLLAAPGRVSPGTVIETPVRQVDVLPTLLGLQGRDAPAQVRGRDLIPLLAGEPLSDAPLSDAPVYAESEFSSTHLGFAPLHAIVMGRFKLIEAPTPRLFDLENDPGELANLAEREPERLAELRGQLESLRATMQPRAALRPRAGANGADPASRVDPMDRIHVLKRYREAIALGQRQRYREMVEPLESALADAPDAVGLRALLGVAYVETGRVEEGLAQLETALELDPRYEPTHFYLGRAHAAAGDLERAASHFRRTLELQPASHGARVALALVLVELGDVDGALEQYGELLSRRPREGTHWASLARLLADEGRHAELLAALERGVAASAEPELRDRLAWLLATSPEEDLRDPARALELATLRADQTGRRDPHVLDVLAAALAALGRFPEALATAKEAILLAVEQDDAPLRRELEDRLEAYREGRRIIDG